MIYSKLILLARCMQLTLDQVVTSPDLFLFSFPTFSLSSSDIYSKALEKIFLTKKYY